MKSIFDLLRSRPQFFRVFMALFISGVGTAMTSVAVYQELSRIDAGSVAFAVAYAAGLIPGFFTSLISGRFGHRWNIRNLLLGVQGLGLLSLVFPFFAYSKHNLFFLIMAEVMSSAVSGLMLPAFKGLERSSFSSDDFAKLAIIDTWAITAHFIFGQGLGAILASQVTFHQFLIVDALTYLIAIFLLWSLQKELKISAQEQFENKYKLSGLNPSQKRALSVLPWLALICAPPMVLLPARASQWGSEVALFGGLGVAPVLLILCFRTIGQLIGPYVAGRFEVKDWAHRIWTLPVLLLVYLTFYLGAYFSNSFLVVVFLVMFAHIASNMVYAAGTYHMLQSFDATETVWASGLVYRMVTMISGLSSLVLAYFTSEMSAYFVVAVSFMVLTIGSIFIFGGQYNGFESSQLD